ncbi:MAG: UDP-N-acetylglucosamine--N-acetylmuramyl-(pentapeptide) pyrophosphoryl-undecaprenol N-acetylglucosamine transferase, partial [Bdellovibrio sp.]
MRNRSYFIAGGGTGGHVFPALAVAKALQELDPQTEIFFVGTPTGLENKIVPQAGFRLFLLPVGKLNFKGRWLEKMTTLARLPWALFLSAR